MYQKLSQNKAWSDKVIAKIWCSFLTHGVYLWSQTVIGLPLSVLICRLPGAISLVNGMFRNFSALNVIAKTLHRTICARSLQGLRSLTWEPPQHAIIYN